MDFMNSTESENLFSLALNKNMPRYKQEKKINMK